MRELAVIQVFGAARTKLLLMFPLSLCLNLVAATITTLVFLLFSVLNPLVFLATLVDIPSVLIQTLYHTFLASFRGIRRVPLEDVAFRSSFHPAYGHFEVLEVQTLNQNNVIVGRRPW